MRDSPLYNALHTLLSFAYDALGEVFKRNNTFHLNDDNRGTL